MVEIRLAAERDGEDIEEIAKSTWDGHDYLAQEFTGWLEDGNFYVIEHEQKVIGTGKLTLLPGHVGWLEGLRVHPGYQKQGLGRMMHNFLMKRAEEIEYVHHVEFATHMFNRESVGMALKDGFAVVKRFYLSFRERGKEEIFKPAKFEPGEIGWKDYIPCGWKFLRVLPETPEYLSKCGAVGTVNGCKFLYPFRNTEIGVSPAAPTAECFEKVMGAASAISRRKNADKFAFMVPEETPWLLSQHQTLGFESWVDFREADVLIFRKSLGDKN